MPIPRIDAALIAATTWENNPEAFWEIVARFDETLKDIRDADLHTETRFALWQLAEPLSEGILGPVGIAIAAGRTLEQDAVWGFEVPPGMRLQLMGGCAFAGAGSVTGGFCEWRVDNVACTEQLILDATDTPFEFAPIGLWVGGGQRVSLRANTEGGLSFTPLTATLWVRSEHLEGATDYTP